MEQYGLCDLFESICCTNGDDTAFIVSSAADIGNTRESATIGFTELSEAVKAIAAELCHRHDIVGRRFRKRRPADAATAWSNIEQCVWIVSSYPSPGETAAGRWSAARMRIA